MQVNLVRMGCSGYSLQRCEFFCRTKVCTHSYFVIGPFEKTTPAENLLGYLQTKFVRFLIMQSMSAVNVSKAVFAFVPLQDFSKPWTDEELYKKYGLTDEEIQFIESMICPME